jgi:hypothetical protein
VLWRDRRQLFASANLFACFVAPAHRCVVWQFLHQIAARHLRKRCRVRLRQQGGISGHIEEPRLSPSTNRGHLGKVGGDNVGVGASSPQNQIPQRAFKIGGYAFVRLCIGSISVAPASAGLVVVLNLEQPTGALLNDSL